MALLHDGARSSVVPPGISSAESDFIFKDGVFYATFEGHNHPRKSAAELYEHLTYVPPPPEINENGKRTWSQPQNTYVNHPAHFYAAQLLHYGLKPLKTKIAAKKKLLSAFSGPDGEILEVPKSILELEETMRKRSQSNLTSTTVNQKAVPDNNKDVSRPVSPTNATVMKPSRSKQTARKNTKPTVPSRNVIFQPSIPGPTMPKSPLTNLASSSNRAPRTKQTAIKTSTGVVVAPRAADDLSKPSTEPWNRASRTKQTARKSSGGKPPKSSATDYLEPRDAVKRFQKSLAPDELPQMTDAEMRHAIKSLSAERVRQILERLHDRIPAVADPLEKELSSAKKSNSSKAKEKPVNPSIWTGIYDIEAPTVEEEQYGAGHFSFEIYASSTSKHLWASFEIGNFTGIMRSIHPTPNFLNTEIFFEWRGHMEGSGMTFSDTDRAVITFLPGGLLEGKMCVPAYRTYRIYGCRPARGSKTLTRKQQLDEVSTWKSMWRYINDHNYEVERIARWGKYGGQKKQEEAFASDTTYGKHKRSSKINLKNFMHEPSSDDESYGGDDDEKDDGW